MTYQSPLALFLIKYVNFGVPLPSSTYNPLRQFTVVLKLLLEKSDVPADEVEHIDISTTLVALAGFIARFNNPLSYRIRLKLCALCDCVCERTETLTLRRDTNARHLIIDILMEWIQDPHIVRDEQNMHEFLTNK